eukprot:2969507-Amphidinium_carterae.1
MQHSRSLAREVSPEKIRAIRCAFDAVDSNRNGARCYPAATERTLVTECCISCDEDSQDLTSCALRDK